MLRCSLKRPARTVRQAHHERSFSLDLSDSMMRLSSDAISAEGSVEERQYVEVWFSDSPGRSYLATSES